MAANSREDFRSKYERFFREADVNDDGRLNVKELKMILYKLGFRGTDQDVARIFVDIAAKGEKTISFNKFMDEMLKVPLKDVTQNEWRILFRRFDHDGNGFVSRQELSDCLRENEFYYTEQEVEEMMKKADRNGDGTIDYEEFLSALQ